MRIAILALDRLFDTGLTVVLDAFGLANRFSARMMGTKSPIFDIEHLQLFERSTGAALMRTAGFESIAISSLRNRYPIQYWIKLFPLPRIIKAAVSWMARVSGIGNVLLSLPAGNLAILGQKPV